MKRAEDSRLLPTHTDFLSTKGNRFLKNHSIAPVNPEMALQMPREERVRLPEQVIDRARGLAE
jgi:hypothetical protein